ncbi:hemerythrin HHE cation binding domain protein [Sulfuriferula multivorans]|uniref:Hemerythrin HHE cation binding domain protein n=1 Tax=Sulfuriferula multivorans TaxID=1559896 RepID=A0A401JZP8_9PROT|nr:hemerythrin domain-containing protein [Sulfuriferula multivorans]GCB02118.1 hemerythrin HHE cation binding domain protein [Sulfuriferula multivorans]
MTADNHFCDLTGHASSQLQTSVFYEIKDMARGETVTFLFAEDPAIILHSLNLQLRNNLRWEVSEEPGQHWRAVIHRAEDVPPVDVLDMLKRDHKRLDAMFSQVIHLTDNGQLEMAHGLMRAFTEGLRKHLRVEHDLLARAIRTPPNSQGFDPSAAMVQEHNEILNQSVMIEAGFEETDASSASVGPLLAILAGYLSKHEQREEATLFPVWTGALNKAPEQARMDLFNKVMEILQD